MKLFVATSSGVRVRKNKIVASAAFIVLLTASTGAVAQVPPPPPPATPNCNFVQTPAVGGVLNLHTLAAPASSVAGSLSGAIGNMNTIFLTQQGSAFVSAPPDPAPDQPGGGVWARAVGGEVNLKSTSTSNGAIIIPANPGQNTSISTTCANNQNTNFAGVQVGQDIARLNWGGWNVHLGTTAGYVSSGSTDSVSGFQTNFEVPFFGTYLVATHGRFFSDIMVREEFYNMRLNDPTLGYFNQPAGARGVSVAVSAGYNFDLGQNWFLEPSAGFIASKTHVDSFNSGGTIPPGIAGTNSVNDINSDIGRLSLRAGKTIVSGNMIWQPFGSVSVFHEFAGPVTSSFVSINAVQTNNPPLPPGTFPATFTQTTSTTRVGTYGQYSLGLAAQVANTGWLGFVRVDYRNGDNINGWTGNGGIRYQFTPDMIAAVMPTKAPVKARGAVLTPVNWTGFYAGGFFGVDYGTTDNRFVGSPGPDGSKIWSVGALGGGEVGYNYQVNKWVFGVEGDIGGANIKGGRTCGAETGIDPVTHFLIAGAFSPAFFACTDKMNWVATATARVGYAYERTLFYVKAGAAFTNDRMTANCIVAAPGGNPPCTNQAGVAIATFGASSNRAGFTIGYGTEFDLGHNWSAKAEYDYIDFGRKTMLASDGTTFLSDHPTTSQVKIGVNYHFSGPGVVVAKY
jgi:opacity protein-like surface antigen